MFFCTITFSQDFYTSKSKKAIKHFEAAVSFFDKRDNKNALEQLNKALETDNQFLEAYMMVAIIREEMRNYDKSIECLQKVIEINPQFSWKAVYNLARIEFNIGKYEEAKEHYLAFKEFDVKSKETNKIVDLQLKRCDFAIYAVSNPVPYEPKNLGANVNSAYQDYWPSLTVDEKTLVITVEVPIDPRFPLSENNRQEDFFMSKKVDNEWQPMRNIGPPLNTPLNEGAQIISADGKMMFFTGCNRKEGMGSCDIYYSNWTGNGWSEAQNLGAPVNSGAWETQPSIASDGKTLYFVSNRGGGKGKMDIWKSEMLGYDAKGRLKWTKPVNLGDSINTADDEMCPFIHPDNKTLYFSSNGWIGMGGFDLFYSRKANDTTWLSPKNIGYPINSQKDDIGLIVNASGNMAMLSSDREGENGKDIYEFNLYKEAQPIPVTYVKGVVYDVDTKQRLEASFELMDLESAQTIVNINSNPDNGEYLVCLPIDKNYAFNVSKKGYLFYSDNFSLKNLADPSKPYLMDIALQPIKVGQKMVLKNIFYETDSYELKPESKAELGKLIAFIKDNPNVQIEIGGHTDNVGSKEHNEKLSNNRAKNVFDYLVNHGINSMQLSYKGYGFSATIASNNTEEGKALNRRTEFKIIAVK